MAGDYSRFGFDPRKHFSQVLLQQGRVFTDRDYNEQGSILERRLRAQTLDTMGRCVVPSETPDGFRIEIAGSGDEKSLTIGRGRIYVDGLLAENHGEGPLAFDLSLPRPDDGRPVGVLAEQIGEEPTSYITQRYWPLPDDLPEDGVLAIVYLRVWQREVTAVVDPDLLEPALGGVDTTARFQTAWQVKWIEVDEDVLCSTPDADIGEWQQLIGPSAARLTTRTLEDDSDDNPCLIPRTGGYTGAENQLYRVQVHDGGSLEQASLKWSRDNASFAARIQSVAGLEITLDRAGRDDVLSFREDGWVEITDDARELGPVPGVMARVAHIEGNRITLVDSSSDELFPNGFDEDLNPRAIKWDSDGAVAVPAQDTEILLGSGIAVELGTDPPGGQLRSGDYWTFAARTATGGIELLDRAPPRGIHYHYCRLALVRWPDGDNEQPHADDCRIMWPSFGGETCGCSVCVTPETHNSGALTIHQAIDQVAATGGTVCLGSGEYDLRDQPVRIQERSSIRVTGQGVATTLSFTGAGPAVIVDGSVDIAMERFSVFVQGQPRSGASDPEDLGGGPGFLIRNSLRVTVERCAVNQFPGEDLHATGVVLEGGLLETVLRENVFFTTSGILTATTAEGDETSSYLSSADLEISANLFLTSGRGVGLDRLSFFLAGSTRIQGNTFLECSLGAISSTGLVFASRLDIRENQITAGGPGIVVGTDNTRVCDNDITSAPGSGQTQGIVVTEGIDGSGIDGLYITGNRLVGLTGRALVLDHIVHTAMIKQNLMALTGEGGIFMAPGATASALEIENNQFVGIAQSDDLSGSVAAIRVFNTDHLRIANNTIKGVARNAIQPQSRAAIEAVGCNKVFVLGNDIVDVGPADHLGISAGIQIRLPFANVLIENNVARRGEGESDVAGPGDWSALRIVGPESSGGGGAVTIGDFTVPGASNGGGAGSGFAAGSDFAAVVHVPVDNRMIAVTDVLVADVGAVTESRVTVQGNQLHGRGGTVPAVQIGAGDTCLLIGNQITGEQLTQGVATTRVEAARVAASSNIIQGPGNAVSLSLEADAFTVIGNITSGAIQVNQETLDATTGTGLNVVSTSP